MAIYPARLMPVPNDNAPQPVDRKAALAAAAAMESPAEARVRRARGGAIPLHCVPTAPREHAAAAGQKMDLASCGAGQQPR